MNIRDQILEDYGEDAETMLFADGFDDAIVGVGNVFPIFIHKIERQAK